ncbi:MAG: hypothetical protein K6G45_13670, partial [Lachnospiraceae bacterium]|nr:hypothetical protein [Lachnospiraceae bacterium]
MQKSSEKRNFRTIRKVAMSATIAAVMVLYLPVMALAGDYDIDEGSVDIHAYEDRTEVTHKNETHNDSSPNVYSTSGETTQNTVTIRADRNATANVTLSGVDINTRSVPNNEEASGNAAVSVNGAGIINIELDGDNSLTGGNGCAGIQDNMTGTLTINDA